VSEEIGERCHNKPKCWMHRIAHLSTYFSVYDYELYYKLLQWGEYIDLRGCFNGMHLDHAELLKPIKEVRLLESNKG